MTRLKFHSAARAELDEAFEYLENEGRGLGANFLAEVSTVIERVLRYPLAAPRVGRTARAAPVKNFRYHVVYTVKGDMIVIVAVMHNRRRPGYWKGRI